MHAARDTERTRANTVPRRRAMLGAAITALLAQTVGSGSTQASAPTVLTGEHGNRDAELIAACDQLTANQIAWLALIESRHSIEDEERTEPENLRLFANRVALLARIEALPPASTMAGAAALARAALADWPLDLEGHVLAHRDCEWLGLMALNVLVSETRVRVAVPYGAGAERPA